MNNLAFRSKWPGKKGRDMYNNIPEKKVWKACQKIENGMRGKIYFQIDNTATVSYLLKEVNTYCKTFSFLQEGSYSTATRMG